MPDLRSKDTPEKKEYWDFVEQTAQKVAGWPEWMMGPKPSKVSKTASEPDIHALGHKSEGR